MYKLRFLLSVAATLFFSLALCATTQAQLARTYVSGLGDDTNPCTRTAPCRAFQIAHDALPVTGGEVVALDNAGYGPVIITKNVTISGEGVKAEAAPYSTEDGITIATPGLTVVLRSISIAGFGTGGTGINVSVAVNLTIQNCTINGFTGNGLSFVSSGGKLSIDNSRITNNGNNGIVLNGNGGTLLASIGSSRIENSGADGLAIIGAKVTIRNSVTSGNVLAGIDLNYGPIVLKAESPIVPEGMARARSLNYAHVKAVRVLTAVPDGSASELTVESCESSNNGGDGIVNNDTSIVRVSRSSVTGNGGYGFNNAGKGRFLSRVDKIESQHLVDGSPVNITSKIFSNTVEGNTAGDKTGGIGTYGSL